ncbi:MAG: ATP-binding protein, partial [Bdellovibrionota bacterium]
LGGMARVSSTKVRPLLSFSRQQIIAVAREWKVEWREDSSNLSSKYERNWLRNEILPLLEARRPGFSRRLADLAEEVRSAPSSIAPATVLFGLCDGIQFGTRSALLALGSRGLKITFSLDRKHSAALLKLLEKGNGECLAPKTRFSLSQGILLVERGRKFADELVWSSEGATKSAESVLGKWVYRDLKLGGRKELAPGMKGKKKFQEASVPLFFRDSVPVLSSEGGKIQLTLAPNDNLSFEPSALGAWWISSSVGRDGLGPKTSK